MGWWKNNETFLSGFNTDVYGFEKSLNNFLSEKISKAIILGTGGAALAAAFVLKKKNIDFVVLGLHFSNAYQVYPAAHILENVKKIFSHAGPDVILGNHAHHIQPSARINFVCPFTQNLKAGFVNFACGDFIAYDIFNWGHLTVYLKLYVTKGINTNNSTVTFLEHVEFKPVYICGTYKSKDNRDLRLLDAEKLNEKIKNKNVPDFLTPYHLKEFEELKILV